jgi:hypothetical protein
LAGSGRGQLPSVPVGLDDKDIPERDVFTDLVRKTSAWEE